MIYLILSLLFSFISGLTLGCALWNHDRSNLIAQLRQIMDANIRLRSELDPFQTEDMYHYPRKSKN